MDGRLNSCTLEAAKEEEVSMASRVRVIFIANPDFHCMPISCIRPAAGDGGFPLAEQPLADTGLHLRLEAAVGAPEAFDLSDTLPEPASQAGQLRRPPPRGRDVQRTD